MPYGSYVNKVRKHTCPYCGIERNLDWFIKDMAARAGYDIPAPLVLRDASRLPRQQSGYRPQPVLVDDVHKFFDRYGLRPVVMTLPFNAVEFFFDKSVIKQANPSLFQVLRTWWRCKKEFMK